MCWDDSLREMFQWGMKPSELHITQGGMTVKEKKKKKVFSVFSDKGPELRY